MSVRDFVPHWAIAILFAAFWFSQIQIGEMIVAGEDLPFAKTFLGGGFGLFVSVVYWLSGLFAIAFPIAFGYDNGWRRAVVLVLIAIMLNPWISVGIVLLWVDEADEASAVMGGIATVLTVALMLALAFQVSWFRFLGGPPPGSWRA